MDDKNETVRAPFKAYSVIPPRQPTAVVTFGVDNPHGYAQPTLDQLRCVSIIDKHARIGLKVEVRPLVGGATQGTKPAGG